MFGLDSFSVDVHFVAAGSDDTGNLNFRRVISVWPMSYRIDDNRKGDEPLCFHVKTESMMRCSADVQSTTTFHRRIPSVTLWRGSGCVVFSTLAFEVASDRFIDDCNPIGHLDGILFHPLR